MRTTTAIGAMAMLALGACASTGTSDHAGGTTCQPDAAAALVGQVAPDDDTILRLTHSKTVRRIAPGDAITMDFREDRVTVTVAEGRIVSASCG